MTRAKPFPESDMKCRPMESLAYSSCLCVGFVSFSGFWVPRQRLLFSKTRKFIKTQDVISEDSKGRIFTLFLTLSRSFLVNAAQTEIGQRGDGCAPKPFWFWAFVPNTVQPPENGLLCLIPASPVTGLLASCLSPSTSFSRLLPEESSNIYNFALYL